MRIRVTTRYTSVCIAIVVATMATSLMLSANPSRPGIDASKAKIFAGKTRTKLTASITTRQPFRGGMTLVFAGSLKRSNDNKPVSGREIIASIKHPLVRITLPRAATSSNGAFRLRYKLPAKLKGRVSLTIQFKGDVKYYGAKRTIRFTVAGPKANAYLFWHNAKGPVGKTIAVNVTLKRGKSRSTKGIANKRVYLVRVRGPRYPRPHVAARIIGRGTTDRNGRANIAIKLNDRPLTYDLVAHLGDAHRSRYKQIKPKSHTLTITKANYGLFIVAPSSARIGQTIKYKFRISRSTDRKPLGNREVRFRGQRLKTKANGEVSFEYQVTASGGLGLRSLEVRIKGDDFHNEKIHKVRLKVLPSIN